MAKADDAQASEKTDDTRRLGLVIRLFPAKETAQIEVQVQGQAQELGAWVWPSPFETPEVKLIGTTRALPFIKTQEGQAELRADKVGGKVRIQLKSKRPMDPKTHFLQGHDWFVYPRAWENQPLTVTVRIEFPDQKVAPDLFDALGSEEIQLRGAKPLAKWAALWGGLKRAEFSDTPGRVDRLAARGRFVFDVRWLAAELASLRSAVDDYFLAPHASPFTFMLQGRSPMPGASTLALVRTYGGVHMSLDEEQSWEAAQRLQLTQYLVRKKLVGLLAYEKSRSGTLAKIAFEQGCARHLARHIAFGTGLLSAEEFAQDLSGFAAQGFAALPQQRREAQQAHAAGVAACVGLSHALGLSPQSERSLRDWIYRLRVHRQALGQPLSLAQARSHLEAYADKETAHEWSQTLTGATAANLEAGAFAPCIIKGKQRIKLYDFGFFEPTLGQALGELSAFGKDTLGLREDDVFVRWELDDAQSPREVRLEVLRGDTPKRWSYAPRVTQVKGVQWTRRPTVSDLQCRL